MTEPPNDRALREQLIARLRRAESRTDDAVLSWREAAIVASWLGRYQGDSLR
jgi:hypothetical protein